MVRYCYVWSILFLLFYRFFCCCFHSLCVFLCVLLIFLHGGLLWLSFLVLCAFGTSFFFVVTWYILDCCQSSNNFTNFLTFLLWCPEKIPQNYFSSHMLQCQCQNLDFLFVQNCQRYSFIIVIVFEFFQIWFLSVVTVLQNYNLTIFLLHIVFCTFIYFILLLFFVQAEEFTSAFLWSRYSWNVWKVGLCGSFDVIAQ